MIFVIDDDEIMAECVVRSIDDDVRIFTNAIDAMNELSCGEMPRMIFLDIMLDGPDGFTFLNELVSYSDTSKIPVVVMSSFGFEKSQLTMYGVVEVLNKDTMKPEDIKRYVREYAK